MTRAEAERITPILLIIGLIIFCAAPWLLLIYVPIAMISVVMLGIALQSKYWWLPLGIPILCYLIFFFTRQ